MRLSEDCPKPVIKVTMIALSSIVAALQNGRALERAQKAIVYALVTYDSERTKIRWVMIARE